MSSTTPAPLDLNNVQGDILAGLVKKTETYLFFQIGGNVPTFRKQLSQLIPLITSTAQVKGHRDQISQKKNGGSSNELLQISAVNISFSHKGVIKLGITDSIGDPVFDAGMIADAQNLGDKGTTSGTFVPDWLPAFKDGNIDGLIIISGDCHATVSQELKNIEKIFLVGTKNAAIREVLTIVGDVRPGKEKGHEHFGFLDGISQPAVEGVDTKPNPGQETVPQGTILTGRDQDAVPRPPWALDGSFLSFRYLTQLVPEFNTFLKNNPIPGMPADQGSEFTGARMVGRWKSGAPLDLAPLKDDPELGADPLRNNNFSYGFPGDFNTQDRCPFAAHLRKTNPRDDLEKLPPTDNPAATTKRRIIRRGIQFGPELTQQEIQEQKTIHERGLLFAAYSSNIANGFQFIQHSWANNAAFPPQKTTLSGTTLDPGLDPIIGQTNADGPRTTFGIQPSNQDSATTLPTEWVVPKGGEYFFTPSIPALKNTFALADEKSEL